MAVEQQSPMELEKSLERSKEDIQQVLKEIGKAYVGERKFLEDVLATLFCSGHGLIEGVPGLGKTYLIKTLGQVLGLQTGRIQFTPDLMPGDILGTNVLMEDEKGAQAIRFQKGPIFTQILLADEINRATPKTQSALLEAMQEKRVTISGETHRLAEPFIVLGTQNPIEMEGTYPLPEAQLDRFFFKLQVPFPGREELGEILRRTTGGETLVLNQKLEGKRILEIRDLIRQIPVNQSVQDYAVRMVLSTHPDHPLAPEASRRYFRHGASPRGAQTLLLAGKYYALLDGRTQVSYEDIQRAALPALGHRVILGFSAEAEGKNPEELLSVIVSSLKLRA